MKFFDRLMEQAAQKADALAEEAARPLRDVPLMATPGFGEEGVARIQRSSVLLIGLGGLGCAAAPYLVAAGVRSVLVCDFDAVFESNLGRQVLYGHRDIRRRKTEAAVERLQALNDRVRVNGLQARADAVFLAQRVPTVDLVLDASDNYGTRLAVNDACVAHRRPWVMGAVTRSEGQLMTLRPDRDDAPCYRCAYGDAPEALEDCAGGGIAGPVAGMIGAAMAMAALQVLAGQETAPTLKLLDAAAWQWRTLSVNRRGDCEACGQAAVA